MKVTHIETLHCMVGWRPWSFVKITTDDGLIGYSDCTESFGSRAGVATVIKDLAQYVIGQDPLAIDKIYWDLYRRTRQSVGGIAQKAIGGIENALLDIKGKALNVPVYQLLGGPFRDKIRVYWSHCGTTRARSYEYIDKPPLNNLAAVTALGKEVKDSGYTALKTNIIFPGEPAEVIMQGFKGGYGSTDQNVSKRILTGLDALVGTFRDAVGPDIDIMLDLNFNFRAEGNVQIARTLESHSLTWLEVDSHDAKSLRYIRDQISMPLASCENLFTLRGYQPYLEQRAADVVVIDLNWNGIAQAKKIADMAEIYDMNVAPHNHYSPLATLMAAHFCMAVPNLRILELDVDDVSWANSLVTEAANIDNGYLTINNKPGWGADLNEELLKEFQIDE